MKVKREKKRMGRILLMKMESSGRLGKRSRGNPAQRGGVAHTTV
jgi:hypothetical protein